VNGDLQGSQGDRGMIQRWPSGGGANR
jgi:hypothetical protein